MAMAWLSVAEEYRQTAEEAARLAGREVMQRWEEPSHAQSKGLRDIVTEADVAAERVVIETIQRRYPKHTILAEESGMNGRTTSQAECCWFIDPLDGTTNYARRIPCFSVSIAVACAGRSLAGVVYDPLRDLVYSAARGGGSFCDGRQLHASRRDRLIDLLIAVDWPRQDEARSRLLRRTLDCSPRVGSWRSFGSAALGLCYVADGLADAYVHPTLHPWDMAAAGLIVEEAGGRITGLDGSTDWLSGPTCLASNGLVHEQLLDLLHWYDSRGE